MAEEITKASLASRLSAYLRFTCSSLVINAAGDLHDAELAEAGKALAGLAIKETDESEPFYFQCLYNLANAMTTVCDLGLPASGSPVQRETMLVANRLSFREELREARRLFLEIASSDVTDAHTRSAALCNLANSLDHSGRWAEAYDFYLEALEADPRNGNAAGNLALLLQARIALDEGQVGHLAAVYDKYVSLAQSLRNGTVDFAGEETAARWQSLELTGSEGHLSHGVEGQDDDYRGWVAAFRLPLSPAVEGLGTEGPHWDSSVIERLYGVTLEEVSPPILAEMNVLKSDYLVSRRLAYEGYVQVADGPEQKPDDTGFYVETLDYSLYGTQYSKLLLAQRSALDVLDKTAVVANEHFGLGDRPDKVSFRSFWTATDGTVRPGLVSGPGRAMPAFALAELAFDMEKDKGMYAASQALRNAGTHRIVHAAILGATGVTVDSRSRIDYLELINSTIQALQVTRSAYLYITDLVASWNRPDDHPGPYAPVETYEYMNYGQPPEDPVQATDAGS